MSPAVPHRLLRTGVSAGLATAAGIGAHVLGGGTVPGPGALGALVALAVPIWILAGRERRFAVIAAVQLAGQQLVHASLELITPSHVPLPDDVSLYGHLLAAVAIAGWLRTGERRLWAAAQRAARAVAAWCRRSAGPTPARMEPLPVAPASAGLGAAGPGAVLRHVLVRRGPPLPT